MKKIFSHPVYGVILTLITCALWGSLFPFIKIGYSAFRIDSGNIPEIMLFAGLRFTLSGVIMVVIFSLGSKKPLLPEKKDVCPVLTVAFLSIVLHYAFTYVALSMGEGSKSAIIKQVGFLFLSCLSFLFVKGEHFSTRKLLCGVLGFLGIIVTGFDGGRLSFAAGDAMLLAASLCAVAATLITKRAVEKTSPLTLTAYSQLIGGAVMCIGGLALGGRITYFDVKALGAFVYICAASIIAYVTWNTLIKYNSVAKMSIIKFTEPLFAVIFSGIFLGEDVFKTNYVIALVVILLAILLDNGVAFKRSNESTGQEAIEN